MKAIAFFDFDGTITTKDTLLEFLKFAKGKVPFVTGFFLNSPFLVAYKIGLISNQTAKEKVFSYFFKGTPIAQFQQICDAFSREKIPALVRPKATELLQQLQQDGTPVVIVSASFGNWIAQWAAANNFQLIATIPEEITGRLTGRIAGKNCHGDEKVRRIKAQFDLAHYETIHAFGDTSGDKPMLALATHPHYKPFRN